MRALGPGSVSSFLKIILDVVFAALWIGVAVFALIALVAMLLTFNPDLLPNIRLSGELEGQTVRTTAIKELTKNGPSLTSGLFAAGLYLAGILVIVGSLRRIFTTLTAGDPLHPDNVARLRLIGLLLDLRIHLFLRRAFRLCRGLLQLLHGLFDGGFEGSTRSEAAGQIEQHFRDHGQKLGGLLDGG